MSIGLFTGDGWSDWNCSHFPRHPKFLSRSQTRKSNSTKHTRVLLVKWRLTEIWFSRVEFVTIISPSMGEEVWLDWPNVWWDMNENQCNYGSDVSGFLFRSTGFPVNQNCSDWPDIYPDLSRILVTSAGFLFRSSSQPDVFSRVRLHSCKWQISRSISSRPRRFIRGENALARNTRDARPLLVSAEYSVMYAVCVYVYTKSAQSVRDGAVERRAFPPGKWVLPAPHNDQVVKRARLFVSSS